MAGFHPLVDQSLPDLRQLLDTGTEQVDALTAGDLHVESEILGDGTYFDQLFGRDLTAGHPRHHRVGAVLLQVGQEMVVGVLQGGLFAVENVLAGSGGQDRGDGRLADITPDSGAVLGDQLGEGTDSGDPHDLEQFRTRLGEVLTQRLRHLHARLLEQFLDHGNATATGRSGGRAILDRGDIAGALVHGPENGPFGHVVAGADLRLVGQCVGAEFGTGG